MDVSKNFVQAIPCISTHKHTHTCICFQKNESIFNPKEPMRANNMWDVWNILVRTFLNEFRFFWVFLYLLPIFQSILGTHEFFGSQKALKDAVAYIGFCTALKNVTNFQFLAREFKMCPKGPTMLLEISISHGSTRNYKIQLGVAPNHGSWGKEDYFILCE